MTREITITPVLNGWSIRVGCQTVVFEDKAAMLLALSQYYDKPEQTEKEFMERAKNRVAPDLAQDNLRIDRTLREVGSETRAYRTTDLPNEGVTGLR